MDEGQSSHVSGPKLGRPGHVAAAGALQPASMACSRRGADGRLAKSSLRWRFPVAQALLQAGADPNSANSAGNTALMATCDQGHTVCVQALLQAGADPNSADAAGFTVLMAACQKGHEACVQALLKAGADPKIVDSDGDTAQMLARQNGHEACIEMLLKAAAGIIGT